MNIDNQNIHESISSEKYKYFLDIDRLLITLVKDRRISFHDIIKRTKGVFPALIKERLIILDLNFDYKPASSIKSDFDSFANVVELHPIDFEWYFTHATAKEIAAIYSNKEKEVLCLGVPTVADAIASLHNNVTLIDKNPYFFHRFPNSIRYSKFFWADINCDSLPYKLYPFIILDAPWYTENILIWLSQAYNLISEEGTIAFSLFPSLVRPGAEQERENILEYASQLGGLEINSEALQYETPLFEKKALEQHGLNDIGNWRSSDLVTIKIRRKMNMPPLKNTYHNEKWHTFVINGQVAKMRKNKDHKNTYILKDIFGTNAFSYDSVSRRNRNREKIDLWTSRNKVAVVGQSNLVALMLKGLSEGKSTREILKKPEYSKIEKTIKTDIEYQISKILEIN
jgi:hypothetical protein